MQVWPRLASYNSSWVHSHNRLRDFCFRNYLNELKTLKWGSHPERWDKWRVTRTSNPSAKYPLTQIEIRATGWTAMDGDGRMQYEGFLIVVLMRQLMEKANLNKGTGRSHDQTVSIAMDSASRSCMYTTCKRYLQGSPFQLSSANLELANFCSIISQHRRNQKSKSQNNKR
jgi:hypothetical protein